MYLNLNLNMQIAPIAALNRMYHFLHQVSTLSRCSEQWVAHIHSVKMTV